MKIGLADNAQSTSFRPPQPRRGPGASEAVPFTSWRVARDQVLAALLAGQRQLMVTGPPGTGKTLLLHDISRILGAAGWEAEMYRPAASGYGNPIGPSSAKPGVLLVDEADHLTVDDLDMVIASTGCAILLAGLDRLAGACPGWARVKLAPLTAQGGKAYVELWLQQGGLGAAVLSDEAAARAVELSEGVPRLLARLLGGALWLADSQGEVTVTVAHVDDAARLRTALAAPDAFDNADEAAKDVPPKNVSATPVTTKVVPVPATLGVAPTIPEPALPPAAIHQGTLMPRPDEKPIDAVALPSDPDYYSDTQRSRATSGRIWIVVAVIALISAVIVLNQKIPAIRANLARLASTISTPMSPPVVEAAQAPELPARADPPAASTEAADPTTPATIKPPADIATEPQVAPPPAPTSPPHAEKQAATAMAEPTAIQAVASLPTAEFSPASETLVAVREPAPVIATIEVPIAVPVTLLPAPPPPVMTPGAAKLAPEPQAVVVDQPSLAVVPTPPSASAPNIAPTPAAQTPPVVTSSVQEAAASLPLVVSGAPPGPKLPAATLLLLLTRGDQMISLGDVSAARLLYGRAASAGSGMAARAMGRTFDPAFLTSIGAGMAPDPVAAGNWYRLAITLGDAEAIPFFQRIERRKTDQ